MKRLKYIWLLLFALCSSFTYGQKAERIMIRKGNNLYNDSSYVKSEVFYRKALDINKNSALARFNLGDALMKQNKPKEAMEQFSLAAKQTADAGLKGEIFHNVGNLFMEQKDYAKAVDAYKEALRNNPSADDTRYNLVLAMKLLKDQQKQNKDQSGKDQNKEQQKKEQDKKDNKDKQKQQQQQQKQQPQMSKETAEQLLNSVNQDEKELHRQMNRNKEKQNNNQNKKDW